MKDFLNPSLLHYTDQQYQKVPAELWNPGEANLQQPKKLPTYNFLFQKVYHKTGPLCIFYSEHIFSIFSDRNASLLRILRVEGGSTSTDNIIPLCFFVDEGKPEFLSASVAASWHCKSIIAIGSNRPWALG